LAPPGLSSGSDLPAPPSLPDVRCFVVLAGTGRCQLYAGHEGEHAVALVDVTGSAGRRLRLWLNASTAPVDLPFAGDVPRQLAWAPHCPRREEPAVEAVPAGLRLAPDAPASPPANRPATQIVA
jgi:hypothetical protein